MHIILCHERFLPRFGVDRLLLRCAREFRKQGHRVTLIGLSFDPEETADAADETVQVPLPNSYINLDMHTSGWLATTWTALFAQHPPAVAISAGWPFFSSLGVFAEHNCRTIFCDCGITPSEGLPEGAIKTLNLLTGLKNIFVPLADAIAPISDFLLESQVRNIADPGQLIQTIRLSGAHVLEQESGPEVAGDSPPDIVALGRYEVGNYKQSELVIPFASKLASLQPGVKIGVLATPEELSSIPKQILSTLVPLGHPDDTQLKRLIQSARCTVVFSRWEGFNLPLAEAAALGVHCLVLNVGAHPEVAPHPWYLCEGLSDLIGKASALLSGNAPGFIKDYSALAGYGARRSWNQVAHEYLALIEKILKLPPHQSIPRKLLIRRDAVWLIDVTNAAHDPANSGVIRVCRRLANEMQKIVPALFVIWDPALHTFRFPYEAEAEQLSAFRGPVAVAEHPTSPAGNPLLLSHYFSAQEKIHGWLIIPEIRHEPDFSMIRHQANAWGLRTAVIFHDAIPLLRPDLVADPIYRDGHANYMKGLANCNIVLPNSRESTAHLEAFWHGQGFPNARGTTCRLPGSASSSRPSGAASNQQMILCVSTLEPRKGHGRLIEAFIAACGDVNAEWELVLVGNRYAGAPEIADHVEAVGKIHPNIRWLGIVSDEALEKLYTECSFTVFASEIEGFGLPILESIWHGRPCLCHHTGVMAELAEGGGCLLANLTDFNHFRKSLGDLMATDGSVRETLRLEAVARPIKSWSDYAREFLGHLLIVERVHDYQPIPPAIEPVRWDGFIYPNCLLNNWQMNDSERIALDALLARIKPRVAIEIGTFCGGSLSLIRQYCEVVFSLDIDPSVRTNFAWMENVSFLTGNSHDLLPPLFNALEAAAMSPELILIDGDHSPEGVRLDIECVLDFVPRKPCLVVMHDTANAGCRAGQLAARWGRSAYVHYVDLDFVPGRLLEHGGGASGEVWGGLGMALLLPTPRSRPLAVGTTAARMIAHLHALTGKS